MDSTEAYRSLNDVMHMQFEINSNMLQAINNACFSLYRDKHRSTVTVVSTEITGPNDQLIKLIKADYCQRKLGWMPSQSKLREFIDSYGLDNDESCCESADLKKRKRSNRQPITEMIKYMSLLRFTYNALIKIDYIRQSWTNALSKGRIEEDSYYIDDVRYIIEEFMTGSYCFYCLFVSMFVCLY